MRTTADQLFRVLCNYHRADETFAVNSRELEKMTGLGEKTIRRAFRALVDDGRLEIRGRETGKALFAIVPQRPTFGGDALEAPAGTSSLTAASGREPIEAVKRPEDKEAAATYEPAPPPPEVWKFLGVGREPDQGPGICGECGEQKIHRWTYGKFVLCLRCRRRRIRVRRETEVETTLIEVLDPTERIR
jgi:hypothetical protein